MILLVDTHSLIHRSYHAYDKEMRTSTGEQVNAVFGTFSLILRAIRETKPTHLIAAADLPGKTFRHDHTDDYKGNRDAPDEELVTQIIRTKEVMQATGMPVLSAEGFEADDIIGTLTKVFPDEKIVILSSDNDLLQLINENVTILQPGSKGKAMRAPDVVEKWGIHPWQVSDYKALVGDKSDNIKGVAGVGPKAAEQLLNEYGDLGSIYANLKNIKESLRAKLTKGREDAFVSQMLAQIRLDVPVKVTLTEAHISPELIEGMQIQFDALEFKSLLFHLGRVEVTETEDVAEVNNDESEEKTLF